MSKENKNWTEQEDHVLKQLREEQGIQKWSLIAQKMQTEFKIPGKSGKKCRDRYQNHLNREVRRDDWIEEEERLLFRLHDQIGNKWVEIAKILGRSDNAVKNHYHSMLRKALRKINCLISTNFRNEFKPLKNNIISKVLQSFEKQPSHQAQSEPHHSSLEIDKKYLANNLKNKFLNVISFGEHLTQPDFRQIRMLIKELNQFSKTFKNRIGIKNQRASETGEYIRTVKYKGKEILSLISQNKAKQDRQVLKESQQEEFLSNSIQQKRQAGCIAPQQKLHIDSQMVSVSHSWTPEAQQLAFSFFQPPCQPYFLNYLSCNYVIQSHAPLNYSLYPSPIPTSGNPYQATAGLDGGQLGNNLIGDSCVKRETMEEIYFLNRSV